MLYTLRRKLEKHPFLRDLTYAIFFGILSVGFGELKFAIPGFEGGQTDFREIPLIISIFYIRNPLFVVLASLIACLSFLGEGSYWAYFLAHAISVLGAWLLYKYMNTSASSVLNKGIGWSLFITVYYAILLIPLYIVFDRLFGLNDFEIIDSYKKIMSSIKLEMVVTAIITGLYLVQFETRINLTEHRKNLEDLVNNRTEELASANQKLMSMNNELLSSSEEIRSMNANLDGLVKERSKKIEDQLDLLIRYADMNSHEVRAPLARILGLLEIIKLDPNLSDNDKIVEELCSSGEELDSIVRNMNRLLEKEIDSDEVP